VDGGQVGQRPPVGDVDLQVAGVDAGDEPGELVGVAAPATFTTTCPGPAAGRPASS
jgi:hypothetical protein